MSKHVLHANCIGANRSTITYSGTLCDRSTTQIYGDNIAESDEQVTCRFCLKKLGLKPCRNAECARGTVELGKCPTCDGDGWIRDARP